METKTDQLKIGFGALEGTIAQQLKKQKFLFDKKTVRGFEDIRTSYLRLRLNGYLPDAQSNKIRERLFKKILAHVSKLNKPKA